MRRITASGCCGLSNAIYELEKPILKEHLDYFSNNKFQTSEIYKKSGMLYTENENFILIGIFGSNKLEAKQKKKDSKFHIEDLDKFLENLENLP